MYLAMLATTFSYLWFGWLLAFVIIEVAALILSRGKKPLGEDEGGTLSELVWRLTRKDGNIFFRIAAMFAFIGLGVVLVIHFFLL